MRPICGANKDPNNEAVLFLQLNEWLLAQCGARWDNPEAISYLFHFGWECSVMVIHKYIANALTLDDEVFYLKDQNFFSYNDGDNTELFLLHTITNATDVSSDSEELESYIKDWPTRYHFSRERVLAYKSLALHKDMKILEVGSGCGAITRYLGECGAEVLAVEGSQRRARITRARTRDLYNVTVLCAAFANIAFSGTFDLVICNGVLEYSALFVGGDDPFNDSIKRFAALCNEAGSLVVAIENQFGLKYFSSSKEDHTSIMYDGLEGYAARGKGPRTFGLSELKAMLNRSFSHVDVMFPIPDYKLPRALIREELTALVDCGDLFADLQKYNLGAVTLPSFHERLAYNALSKSKLLGDMSNAFFLIANKGDNRLYAAAWLGDIYSIRRNKEHATRSRIVITGSQIVVKKSKYVTNALVTHKQAIVNESSEPWLDGVSVHTKVSALLCRKQVPSLVELINEIVVLWWEAVSGDGQDNDTAIPAEYVDGIWSNAKYIDGKVYLFDQEWTWVRQMDGRWLIYRAVSQFIEKEVVYAHRWNRRLRWYPPIVFIGAVAEIVGVKYAFGDVCKSISNERAFQSFSTGKKLNVMKALSSLFVPPYVRRVKIKLYNSI